MTDTNIAKPSAQAYAEAGTAITRAGFGSTEIEHRRETQATALAERAKAEIQARYIVALQRPRVWETVWGKLIKECDRPGFAEAALYRVPRGKSQVEGLTVGFAMAAMRAMGNVDASYVLVAEDEERVVYRVSVTDVESNTTQAKDVRISKRVERSYVREGQRLISTRENSEGRITYLVEATDEEMDAKTSATISKAKRNLVLDVLPADLKEDCKATIHATRQRANKADPDAAKKRLMAAFMQIGITADALIKHTGQPIEQCLDELRDIFQAIRDGETTWADVTRGKATAAEDGAPRPSSADKVRDRLAQRQAKTAEPKPEGEP